jgi:hypothetical protein
MNLSFGVPRLRGPDRLNAELQTPSSHGSWRWCAFSRSWRWLARALRFPSLILLVALAGGLGAGCVATNPEKFSRQVQQWVPLGTPVARAEHIMARHGFECRRLSQSHSFNPYGVDCLDCDREQVNLHDWSVTLFLEAGKVSKYGPISVDDRVFKAKASGPQP